LEEQKDPARKPLISHETAKPPISPVNEFNDLRGSKRNENASHAKFWASFAKFGASHETTAKRRDWELT
jgi:hypothetical protein